MQGRGDLLPVARRAQGGAEEPPEDVHAERGLMLLSDQGAQACEAPKKRLSFLDEFLTLWIFLAMAAGVGLGHACPEIADVLDSVQVFNVSLPIAVGLLVMMYPPLAQVHYDELGKLREAKKVLGPLPPLHLAVGA